MKLAVNLTQDSFKFDYDSITNLNDRWNQFSWNTNTNTTYYLAESQLCYDSYGDTLPLKLSQFLDETGACDTVCEANSLYNIICWPFDWQNGICNQQCNVHECFWDGGDCNIVCDIDEPDCNIFNMFENGVCDNSCNNTACSFDNGECVQYDESNIKFNASIFGDDATYCDSDTKLCYIEWIDDGWCDENCRIKDTCFYDHNDCVCSQETKCYQLYNAFMQFDDSNQNAEPSISYEGICSLWNFLEQFDIVDSESVGGFGILLEWRQFWENTTCDVVFNSLDLNNNSVVQFNEVLYAMQGYDGTDTEEKASQINCTSCAT